jgi:hypothetical protein
MPPALGASLGSARLAVAPEAKWKPWVVHDLRRMDRSLMSRSSVRPEITVRVLNYVISGVQAVYDCHDYATEKRATQDSLDALVIGSSMHRSIWSNWPPIVSRGRFGAGAPHIVRVGVIDGCEFVQGVVYLVPHALKQPN